MGGLPQRLGWFPGSLRPRRRLLNYLDESRHDLKNPEEVALGYQSEAKGGGVWIKLRPHGTRSCVLCVRKYAPPYFSPHQRNGNICVFNFLPMAYYYKAVKPK